ncbi:MAG: dTDP-4-dehydrorhamnose 3,5-epimerase family protein [Actinobacteria bacterium]|nr:dTDP-4-dehydrorhamnose 3,5-epimerase family protein [Actinomycetota bacterium]
MIEGVKTKKLKVFPDKIEKGEVSKKPGFLMEVLRDDEGLLKKFGQATFTVAYSGTIKAFHLHQKQDDLWFIATGKAKIVLCDLRKESPTFKEIIEIFAGEDDYKVILIPAGVAHGYQVLSKKPVLLFYHTTKEYNAKNPDEIRIPYDDPEIGYDWEK